MDNQSKNFTKEEFEKLYESVANLLGMFDTPVVRRQLNMTDLQKEAIEIAKETKQWAEEKLNNF